MSRKFVLLGSLAFTCCAPGPVPPPRQYAMPKGAEPLPIALDPNRPLVNMGDPDADEHILGGVMLGAGDWRWTSDHARLRIFVPAGNQNAFDMTFFIDGTLLRDTGPVTLTVRINGREIGRQTYRDAGQSAFRRNAGAVDQGQATVTIDVEPSWISPKDGAHLGVLLHEIGFSRP